MVGFFFSMEETPTNHKTAQTNARSFGYFSDIAKMGGMSIIAIVKGNETTERKRKGITHND